MSAKSFTTAARDTARENADDQSWPFDLDIDNKKLGRTLVAFKPQDEQIALLMAETGQYTDLRQKVTGAIDFFYSVFDDDDAIYLRNRLLNRKDDFGLPQVQEIIEWLLEEWSGKATGKPSGSTQSRKPAGTRSRPRTPALT